MEDFEIVGHFLAAEEKAEALNFEIEITHSGFERYRGQYPTRSYFN